MDYLIIIDLEATCDEGFEKAILIKEQEIIEFPWVIFDLHSKKVVDERQFYVKPCNTKITEFCTQLTGISNETVEAQGLSLKEVANQLESYVDEHFVSHNKSFCFACDGFWDMKWMLAKEFKEKGIAWGPIYRKFIDIRAKFMENFPNSGYHGKPGLKFMAEYFRVQIENHHSGIADCKTIAKIVAKMLENGVTFETYEEIPEGFDPDSIVIKDFNKYYTREELTFDQIAYIMDLEDDKESILGVYEMPWLGCDSRDFNFIFILKDYNGVQNKFLRNNILVFVYSAENFLENIRNHDVFTTFLYFLEDKYIIREFPNLPRFSLKLPIFRQVVTEEVGFTVGRARNFWKYQKQDVALKFIETAIRCYALAIQLVEHGKILNWYPGPSELSNSFTSWDEFSSSPYQEYLTQYGKKFTSLVFDSRDKFIAKIKKIESEKADSEPLSTVLFASLEEEERMELLKSLGIEGTAHSVFPNLLHLHSAKGVRIDSQFIRDCNGIILDASDGFKMICSVFPKLRNVADAPVEWTSKIRVEEKNRGMLFALYYYNSEWQLSTPESPKCSEVLDGEILSEKFWRIWKESEMKLPGETSATHMFILSSPKSNYAGNELMYITSCRNGLEVQEASPEHYKWKCPAEFAEFQSLEEAERSLWFTDPTQRQGYVITFKEGTMTQRSVLHSAPYKAWKRITKNQNKANTEQLIILACHGLATSVVQSQFPHLLTEYSNLKAKHEAFCKTVNTIYEQFSHLPDKEFGAQVNKVSRNHRSIVFAMRNKKISVEEALVLSSRGKKSDMPTW